MRNLLRKHAILLLLAFAIIGVSTLSFGGQVLAGITARVSHNGIKETQFVSGFTATTTNATTTPIKIAGAKKVTFFFGRGGLVQPNTGSSRFNVQVSPDGTNWYDFNKLVENLASSTPGFRNASATVSGTSTVIRSLDLEYDAFVWARCVVVETTDGEHSCDASLEFDH